MAQTLMATGYQFEPGFAAIPLDRADRSFHQGFHGGGAVTEFILTENPAVDPVHAVQGLLFVCRYDDCEFIAAPAAHEVRRRHKTGQFRGELSLKKVVAGQMTVPVIDAFEIIQVNQEK
jgi:hypothetical protein